LVLLLIGIQQLKR